MSADQYELVIEGHVDFVKGLLRGIAAGARSSSRVMFNNEHNINRTTIAEKIKEFFDASTTQTHVILDESIVDLIEEVLAEEGEKLKVSIVSKLKLISASFTFKYSAYAEKHGKMLKSMFEDLSESISMSADYDPKESIHPEAKGAEGYAPEHDYEINAKGTVTGDLNEIMKLYERCDDEPLVKSGKIELEFEK